MTLNRLALGLAPVVFVLIWSTGWISAGYAAPYADPLTFLTLRFIVAAALLALISMAMRASWPRGARAWLHALVTGAFLHGFYLAGVWWAVRNGVPTGISGLIAALQPILTAAFSPWLAGERISPKRWLGIGVGFIGIALVLAPKLVGLSPDALFLVVVPIVVNIAGMVAVTLASFYQKRFQKSGDLRTMTTVQYIGAVLVTLPLAIALEPMVIIWNTTMLLVLGWSVIGLSLGGIGLYLMMIRSGEVSRAATLIYLVPPVVVLQAYLLFAETLSPVQMIGVAITVIGVVLAIRR